MIGVLPAIASQTVPYPALATRASVEAIRSLPRPLRGRNKMQVLRGPTGAG